MSQSVQELLLRIQGDSQGGQDALAAIAAEMKKAELEASKLAAELRKTGDAMGPELRKVTEQMLGDTTAKAATLRQQFNALTKEVAGVAPASDKSASALQAMLGVTKTLAGAFGIVFSARAVVDFGRAIFETADQIEKMADQTSFTTDEVQKLMFVSSQSGTKVEALVSAAQSFQQRLGSGDAGLIAAIRSMNIDLDEFNRLSTYEQIELLAEQLRQITSPTELAALAAALFGRTWKEILPAIKAGMRELGENAPRMSESTVKNIAKLGDAWDRFWLGAQAVAANSLNAVNTRLQEFGRANDSAYKTQRALNEELPKMAAAIKSVVPSTDAYQLKVTATDLALAGLNDGLRFQKANVDAVVESNKQATAEAQKLADAHEKEAERLRDVNTQAYLTAHGYKNVADAMLSYQTFQENMAGELGKRIHQIESGGVAAAETLGKLGIRAFGPLVSHADSFVGITLPAVQGGIERTNRHVAGLTDHLRSVLGGVEGVLGGINTEWANMAVVASRTIEGIASNIGKNMTSGNWIGAITAGIAGGVQLLSGLFRDEDHERVNDMRDAYIETAGGLDSLNRAAHDVGLTLDDLLDADDPAEYEGAIRRLNEALEEQASLSQEASRLFGPSQKDLDAAAVRASKLFEHMRASGEYTATQLEQAYYAWQKAMADAGDEAAAAWALTHAAALAGAESVDAAFADLQKQRDGLAQSIANEAPEEVMGVIEAQIRGQIDALDKQMAVQRAALQAQAGDAVGAMDRILSDYQPHVVRIPIEWDVPPIPIGAWSGGGREEDEAVRGNNELGRAHTGAFVRASGLQHFHQGTARVTGLGMGEILAVLQEGEAVIRREAVAALGEDTIRAINAASRPIPRESPWRPSITSGMASGMAAEVVAALRNVPIEVNVYHQTNLDGRVLDERTERKGQEFLSTGRWRVPAAAVAVR